MRENFIPVLLGADLNCYSMARAFFEEYGVCSVAFGKEPLGATKHSRYLSFTAVPDLADPEIALDLLLRFADTHREKTLMLIPCTDEYAYFLVERQGALSHAYLLPVPGRAWLPYFEKDVFYAACDRYGIPYPTTLSFDRAPSFSAVEEVGRELGYPMIVKPTDSRQYWHYPFPGMEKVYLAHNAHAAASILEAAFASGYPGRMLCQRYLGGGDSAAAVLTVYCDRDGVPRLRACGQVMLEEHTPRGKGNYAALLSAPIPKIADPICRFLSEGGYSGFANFDLRRDPRTGEYAVLEMNLRQGRSSHFLTLGGQSPARWLVRDRVLCEELGEEELVREVLFRTVPFSVLSRFAPDPAALSRARALHRTPRDGNPLVSPGDLSNNPLRSFYVWAHMHREKKKFKRYAMPVR